MHLKKSLGASLLILAAAGCSTLAPDYKQPAAPVPVLWPLGPASQPPAGAKQKPLADVAWQEFFANDRLRKTIELALQNNRDLRVALLNVERFQALYQVRRSDTLPKIDATAGASYQGVPETLSGTGKPKNTEQYNVGLGVASYELDLFGRVRSLKDQALEEYLASDQARRSLQISLVSQVATAWLTMAADQERFKLATDTLASQQESYALIKSRYEAGVSSLLDLQQARTSVDAARVDIARYATQLAQDQNALDLLVGAPLAAELLPQGLSDSLTSVKQPTAGLSSDVLLKRPDILQAESQLKGANANIGAARAAFFPKITLVSSVGLGSDHLSNLFKGGAFAWSFAPRITLPIFEWGSNKANLKVSKVDRDIAVARYDRAIQTAFREVSDVLALQGTIDEQLAAQQSLTDASDERYRLSQARYDRGVDSHLNVLDAQRSLYGARQGLIGIRLSRLNNLVTLYKVLGGGS